MLLQRYQSLGEISGGSQAAAWQQHINGQLTNKASYNSVLQGSGGGMAFSDDSGTFFGTTQEGQTGVVKITISGAANPTLNGFAVNNDVYNNLRQMAQDGGNLAVTDSFGGTVVAIRASDMTTLRNWNAGENPTPRRFTEIMSSRRPT